ncbi:arginine/serine-rich protein 1 isoform X3 [Equus asinus]|uniref:arginine/serine-rich protein 1 isoform X3 n=1 Tax=Equus asinus TaxID=9793 RepID=UPI0038F61F82
MSLRMRRTPASGSFGASAQGSLSLRPDVGRGSYFYCCCRAAVEAGPGPRLRGKPSVGSFSVLSEAAAVACADFGARAVQTGPAAACVPGLPWASSSARFQELSSREGPSEEGELRPAPTDMSRYVTALWPGSPRDEGSPPAACSGRSSRRSSTSASRSSSGSSRAGSRVLNRSASGSRSPARRSRRSRSRSRSRRRPQRKYRRSSRSYSRSRSPSRLRAPARGRARSGSRPRVWWRSGCGRAGSPARRRAWRGRSRTRSRSPTPFRLSERDRMELLEIAKANAAKALGTAKLELPASLRAVLVSKETDRGTAVPNRAAQFQLPEKLTEDGTKNPNKKSSQQKSIAFSSNDCVAKPMLQKSAKATAEETPSGSPKINLKKSPYGLWIPV